MERLISVTFFDIHDCEVTDDAIVEFVRYNEDGEIINEVVNVFLPRFVPENDRKALKQVVTDLFHKGEGYNL